MEVNWTFEGWKVLPRVPFTNYSRLGTTISFARVAADGRGHIFAVDCSGFLYVLASDGKHLFSLTGRRFLNLNLVKTVRWFEKTSTLIVSHRETRFARDAITYMNVK